MEENVTQDNNATGGKKKSKVKWIVIAVIAVIIIAAIANGGSDEDDKKADAKKDTKVETTTVLNTEISDNNNSQQNTVFTIGDTADYYGLQITLEKVMRSNGKDPYPVPDDGHEYLIFVFNIQNASNNDASINSYANIAAYCDDTSITQFALGRTIPEAEEYPYLDGNIGSGKRLEGAISYMVPEDWKQFEVDIVADSSTKIPFVVTNE